MHQCSVFSSSKSSLVSAQVFTSILKSYLQVDSLFGSKNWTVGFSWINNNWRGYNYSPTLEPLLVLKPSTEVPLLRCVSTNKVFKVRAVFWLIFCFELRAKIHVISQLQISHHFLMEWTPQWTPQHLPSIPCLTDSVEAVCWQGKHCCCVCIIL